MKEITSKNLNPSAKSTRQIEKFYGRKRIKLILVTMLLLILTLVALYFILNVGYYSSFYKEKSSIAQNLDLGPVMNLFLNKENSFFLYVLMIFLIFLFDRTIIKRILYLWSCYSERKYIETKIINNDKRSLELQEMSHNFKRNGICNLLLINLNKSYKKEKSTKNFYEIFQVLLGEEDEQNYFYNENISRYVMWTIRLGIFGTLMGITIAFYQVHSAMYELSGTTITDEFIRRTQAAMLGNAIAVVTSIAAHGATLVIEMGIAYFLNSDNNVEWLHKTYLEVLDFKEFANEPGTVGENLGSLNKNILIASEHLDKLNICLLGLNPTVEESSSKFTKLHTATEEVNAELTNTKTNLDTTNTQFGGMEEKIKKLSAEANSFNNNLNQTNIQLNNLRSYGENLNNFLKESFVNLQKSGTDFIDNSFRILRTLTKALSIIKKKAKNSK